MGCRDLSIGWTIDESFLKVMEDVSAAVDLSAADALGAKFS